MGGGAVSGGVTCILHVGGAILHVGGAILQVGGALLHVGGALLHVGGALLGRAGGGTAILFLVGGCTHRLQTAGIDHLFPLALNPVSWRVPADKVLQQTTRVGSLCVCTCM